MEYIVSVYANGLVAGLAWLMLVLMWMMVRPWSGIKTMQFFHTYTMSLCQRGRHVSQGSNKFWCVCFLWYTQILLICSCLFVFNFFGFFMLTHIHWVYLNRWKNDWNENKSRLRKKRRTHTLVYFLLFSAPMHRYSGLKKKTNLLFDSSTCIFPLSFQCVLISKFKFRFFFFFFKMQYFK